MQRRWGIAWLAATVWLAGFISAPLTALAADRDAFGTAFGSSLPFLKVAAQTPLETQMLGEKPFQAPTPSLIPESLLSSPPALIPDRDGGATLRLPHNLELRISVLYKREPAALEVQRRSDSSLMFKYAMDYRLLPNLQVGLNGYLYRAEEGFSFPRTSGDRLLGVGPGIKYNLGSWSFILKSQLETGNRERGDGLQNWFRVWYAF
ncbi:MAG: transporter [Desulfobaccales bacterium]|nr:transporter [Desulfobaccales bacterium]